MRSRPLTLSVAVAATLVASLGAAPSYAAEVSPSPSTATSGERRDAPQDPEDDASPRSTAAATVSGTIVFVRGHNLWLVRPDGTGLRRLTADGTAARPYEQPSISDNGIVAAMRGGQIVRIHQNGKVLGVLAPPDLFIPDGSTLWTTPILHPSISRDGSRIAYSQIRARSYGGRIVTESLTGFTDAAQLSPASKYGIVLGDSASWVTASRVVLDRSGDVHLYDLGSGESRAWFRQDDVIPDDPSDPFDFVGFSDTTVARDRSRVLFRFGPVAFGSTATVGDPATGQPAPANGQPQCWITSDFPQQGDENVIESPTFGPDSDSVAYEDAGDLWVLTNLAACNSSTVIGKVLDDAHDPAWSAAPLSAPAPQVGSFTLKAKPRVKGRATPGARLRATQGTWSPAPKAVSYVWLRNGKAIRGARGASYKVRRSDRGDRISVRVTVRRDGYRTKSATSSSVRIRR